MATLVRSAREDRSKGVILPDPDTAGVTTKIEGLVVVTLARLIEMKIACGLGNMRRMHRDFADVIELIVAHKLGRDFARHLHKNLRPTFRALVLESRGERRKNRD